MVVVDRAAVGAHGDIDPRLLEVFIPFGAHVNEGGGLTAANALLLPGDADGAAADAHLDEVGAALGQEPEALAVHHVARAHLYALAVVLPDPGDGALLPLGEALGGVDAQHVRPRLDEGRHPLGIVPGVDARAHHIALLAVQQLQGACLVGVVVLAEYQIHQPALVVQDGQGVDLVVPDDVVGLLEGGGGRGGNQLLDGGHEVTHPLVSGHAADPIVPAGHNTHKAAVGGAVLGDGHGGVAGLFLQGQDIAQRSVGADVGVGHHKAGLIALHPGHHGRLALNGLGAVDEGHAALLGQGDGQLIVGYRLHDGGHHGDVHGKLRLLPHAVLDQGRFQADVGGRALGAGVAWDQQILAEGAGRLAEDKGHDLFLPVLLYCGPARGR